jgi:hypothetical protein
MLLASGRYTENIEPVRESDSTIDGTSMRFNNSFDETKPESKTPLRSAFVSAIETLRDSVHFFD